MLRAEGMPGTTGQPDEDIRSAPLTANSSGSGWVLGIFSAITLAHRGREGAHMEVLDPPAVRRWARLAADTLGRARAEIDALNVFPVADGDTGTNLHLTMLSAAEAVE